MQTDPHQGELDDPITHINKYTYGLNNSVNFTDPTGEFVCGGICIALAITAASLVIDSFMESGSAWENLKDKFKFETYKVWEMEALQAFAMNYALGAPPTWLAWTTFGMDRAANYYEDREERGKVTMIDIGFGKGYLLPFAF